MQQDFWHALQQLVNTHAVVIDRPLGFQHRRNPAWVYPMNYGYLEGTRSGDGKGIDVWLGSGDPATIAGFLEVVDLRKREMEVKLLLGCTEDEIEVARTFQQQVGMAVLLLRP